MARKVVYWVSTWFVGRAVALRGFQLPVGQFAGGSRICARRIPAATAHHSRDRQTLGRDRPRRPRLTQAQRVGLCRIHLCLDLGIYRALFGQRWHGSVRTADIAGTALRLLRDPAAESPMDCGRRSVQRSARPFCERKKSETKKPQNELRLKSA